MICKKYNGVNYYAHSQEELNKKIDEANFQRSIFYRSNVYTYSCFARLLNDNSVELTEYFNNGVNKKISTFKNEDDFWSSRG